AEFRTCESEGFQLALDAPAQLVRGFDTPLAKLPGYRPVLDFQIRSPRFERRLPLTRRLNRAELLFRVREKSQNIGERGAVLSLQTFQRGQAALDFIQSGRVGFEFIQI